MKTAQERLTFPEPGELKFQSGLHCFSPALRTESADLRSLMVNQARMASPRGLREGSTEYTLRQGIDWVNAEEGFSCASRPVLNRTRVCVTFCLAWVEPRRCLLSPSTSHWQAGRGEPGSVWKEPEVQVAPRLCSASLSTERTLR